MTRFKLTNLLTIVLLLSAFAFSQTVAATPSSGTFDDSLSPLPNAFLVVGGGLNQNAGSGFKDQGYIHLDYARATSIDAGTGKKVYTVTTVETFRFGGTTGKTIGQATNIKESLLYPFYDRKFGKVRATLSVAGNAGLAATASNVGYVVGGDVTALLTFYKNGNPLKWGLEVGANPSRASVGAGVNASQASFGIVYGFQGLFGK